MESKLNIDALIVWDRMYDVGIGSVDSEHRMLFNSYNTFIRTKARSKSRLAVGYAMSFLEDYLIYHFRNEEGLMARSGYDRYESHCQEHKHLKSELDRLRLQLDRDNNIGDDLLILFRDWVLRHVVDEDRDIGVFLRCKDRYSKQQALVTPSNNQPDLARSVQQTFSSSHDITKRDGRVSRRHMVNIEGNVVSKFTCENRVNVTNISQGGARISGITGMFKEAAGILTIPSLSLPDLSFICITATREECSVYFTISLEKQDELNRVLRSKKFTELVVVADGPIDRASIEGSDVFDGDAADISGIALYIGAEM